MNKKDIAKNAVALLKNKYPVAYCSLRHGQEYRLLVSVRLAAQCTDARVNIVCDELFEKYPTLQSLADAPLSEIERIVKPCGVYKMKAKNIKDAMNMLLEKHGGRVPDTMEELLLLPGVGRKSANLVLGDIYNLPGAVVADTHCIRISNRLGLCSGKDPAKVEAQLRPLLPPEESNDFCHRLVLFGREICCARSPKCGICPLSGICEKKMA